MNSNYQTNPHTQDCSQTQNCSHSVDQPTDTNTPKNSMYLDFTVDIRGKNLCFHCLEPLVVVGSSTFTFARSLTTEEFQTHKFCPKCKTQLLYVSQDPVAVSNNILDQDINVKIAPECTDIIEEKVRGSIHTRMIMTINQMPNQAINVLHDFPHYFFFNVQTVGEDKYLHLNSYRKHHVNSPTIDNLKENSKQLYNFITTNEKPKIKSRKHTELSGTSFFNIDPCYNEYKSLLFLDIDGTSTKKTLKLTGKLSNALFLLLSKLEKQKLVKTVINTGRPTLWGMLYMNDLGLDPLVIGNNGTGICYNKISFDQTESTRVLSYAPATQQLGYVLDLLTDRYKLKFGILTRSNASCGQLIISNLGVPEPKYLQKLINQDPQLKLYLKETGLENVTCTDDGGGFINIRSSRYNKSTTAKNLINALNYPMSNCFNIGNAENDMPLIELFKENSYGVANSEPGYSKVCNLLKHNQAKGVVQAIKDFLLKKQICTQDQFEKIVSSTIEEITKETQFLFE